MNAIQTTYKGYRFRSRLEAKWAVFFDLLKISWEYEKEGFDLGGGLRYLPDFWLSTVNMWAEVKPDNGFDPIAFKKITELSKQSGFPVLLLEGSPMDKPYKVHFREDPVLYECCLTNYHDYPQEEHRFYAMPGGPSDSHWEDTRIASEFARSAQFEYGKHGN